MKLHYNRDDDTLMIQLSKKLVDDAFETENMIVHISEKGEPVLLEIFNASNFFKKEAAILPHDVKEKFFAVP